MPSLASSQLSNGLIPRLFLHHLKLLSLQIFDTLVFQVLEIALGLTTTYYTQYQARHCRH